MAKFKLKKQYRLPKHDYASAGAYFVTICTRNRSTFFGEIRNGIMGLNEIGCEVAHCWQEIPKHFSNVKLGAWVVMPNHIHGIIWISDPVGSSHDIGSSHGMILPKTNSPILNRFGNTNPGSISSIINLFKGAITRWCRKNDQPHFAWQSRFHDRVIQNDDELDRINEYILNNPSRWEDDRKHPIP